MKIQAIIPNAGAGTRLKADCPKPLVELCGKPLCVYALQAFDQSPDIHSVILVGQQDKLSDFQEIVDQYGLKKVTRIVAGGATRRESVANGIAALDEDTDTVLIHDGARPLVSLQTIADAAALSRQSDALVVAVAVKSTVKKADKDTLLVTQTLDREGLWEVQTPQVFRKSVLVEAHKKNTEDNPSDDAAMVERLGVAVRILPGDYRNIKVTTHEDLTIAEIMLAGAR